MKKRIIDEMTVDYSKALEDNFDLAKQLIRLTKEGEVEISVKDKIGGEEKILLYLVGKLYAKEGGLAPTDEVGNKELMEKLEIPLGSLLPWLKDLRDKNEIRQIVRERHTYHSVPINHVDEILRRIMAKVKKADSVKQDG